MHTFMDTQNIQKIVRVSLNIKDKQGTKVLERSLGLDITIQLLIHKIFSQIIDSGLHFPERFFDFSCKKFLFKTKQKLLSHVNSFWSEVYKKCQKWFRMFEAYLK